MNIYNAKKRIPYFYIIRHKQSKKLYAGCRYSIHCNPNELLKENGYHTSSNIVKEILRKQGLESFEIVEIIQFKTSKEAISYETKFLKEMDVKNNNHYLNLSDNSYFTKSVKNPIGYEPSSELKPIKLNDDNLLKVKIKELFEEIKKMKSSVDIKTKIYEFLTKNSRLLIDGVLNKESLDNLVKEIIQGEKHFTFFSGTLNAKEPVKHLRNKIKQFSN